MPADSLRPLTIALCQFAPDKGNAQRNIARLGALCAQAASLQPRPQVVQFPETAVSGYFVEGAVRELALTTGTLATDLDEAYRLACHSSGRQVSALDVILGFYEQWQDTLYNSAAYITIGLDDGPPVVRHVHRKNFLPTYGLFDEERFVERGSDIRAFETPWGRAAILICEDVWHSLAGTLAALDGAQILFASSAAPARGLIPHADTPLAPGNLTRWETLLRSMAAEQGMYLSFVNLVGSEGGKRFFGASQLVGPDGELRGRAPLWEESFVSFTLDLDDIVRARADAPLLSDLRVSLPHLLKNVRRVVDGKPTALTWDGAEPSAADLLDSTGFVDNNSVVTAGFKASQSKDRHAGALLPVTHYDLSSHGGPPSLEIDPELTVNWLAGFIREELQHRNYDKVLLGISGGIDSAVSAALAVRALGAANVIGVRLPYRTSSEESLTHAQLVIDSLGIESRTVDISGAVDAYLANEPDADAKRRGNVMARMRMIALFDLSERYHALPLGTGNKTERLLGYFTWHADDTPPINPLGDLYKTQVWALARRLKLPQVVIDKAPTADLAVGQTDESDLGVTYADADRILNAVLNGFTEDQMRARGFGADTLSTVLRKLNSTHWKRRLPTTALVSQSGIGEGWHRPVDY